MTERQFLLSVSFVGSAFCAYFAAVVIPPLIANPDLPAAFAAGFVNPYSSGYSADVIACWLILACWVLFEAKSKHIRYGWVCLAVGVIPGVAVGFAAYLVLRDRQLAAHHLGEGAA